MKKYILGSKNHREPVEWFSEEQEDSIDINNTSDYLMVLHVKELEEHIEEFGFPKRATEEAIDPSMYPNAEFYEDVLFMTLNDIHWTGKNKKQLKASEIDLFLSREYLLVVYHEDSESFRHFLDRMDHTNIYRAIYSFIDTLLDHNKKLTSQIENHAIELENRILQSSKSNREKRSQAKFRKEVDLDIYMKEIVSIRKQLQFLKSYYEPTADIIELLEADESDLIPEQYDKYFTKLSLKADRIAMNLTNSRDYITQAREAWQAQMDIDFNKRMNIFTVLTSVFLPLNVIAGWFGMNFKYMHELSWRYGYVAVIILSVFVVGGVLQWVRKNNYL